MINMTRARKELMLGQWRKKISIKSIGLIAYVALSLLTPAMARESIKCPPAEPNEPKLLMACSDLVTTNQIADTFGAMFEYTQCKQGSPTNFVLVPRRLFCEGANRIIRALDRGATLGQTAAVSSDWESKLVQLVKKGEEATSRHNKLIQEQTAKDKIERDVIIGLRNNDTESFERLFANWKNNVNINDREYASIAAWWKSAPSGLTFDPEKLALTTCIDWT